MVKRVRSSETPSSKPRAPALSANRTIGPGTAATYAPSSKISSYITVSRENQATLNMTISDPCTKMKNITRKSGWAQWTTSRHPVVLLAIAITAQTTDSAFSPLVLSPHSTTTAPFMPPQTPVCPVTYSFITRGGNSRHVIISQRRSNLLKVVIDEDSSEGFRNATSDRKSIATATEEVMTSAAIAPATTATVNENSTTRSAKRASKSKSSIKKEKNTSSTVSLLIDDIKSHDNNSRSGEVKSSDSLEASMEDEDYFDKLFDNLAKQRKSSNDSDNNREERHVKLVDIIEQSVGIRRDDQIEGVIWQEQGSQFSMQVSGNEEKGEKKDAINGQGKKFDENEQVENTNIDFISGKEKKRRGRSKDKHESAVASGLNGRQNSVSTSRSSSRATSHESDTTILTTSTIMEEQPPPSVNEKKGAPYNVVCTHITADFDTLASAIGLAKLWTLGIYDEDEPSNGKSDESEYNVHGPLPTYVVLPRGAHPDVQRFLSLHKHLFPIRSLKSLPGVLEGGNQKNKQNKNKGEESSNKGLQRVGLVDAQRRDRLGPAESLLSQAKLGVTIVDHHVDAESDIPEATNYIVDDVGSVSTMISERLRRYKVELTEAEATILALGIHSDTGSLVYDSTTARDASMLGWAMEMGASQAAIAEHAKPSLSDEQQGVLTQALINVNSTTIHGVTISTVLLSADGFISGLAAVTKDALDLSSSDVFLLAVCYEATRGARGGGGGGGKSRGKSNSNSSKKGKNNGGGTNLSKEASDRLQKAKRNTVKAFASRDPGMLASPPLGISQNIPNDSHPSHVTESSQVRRGITGPASQMINSDSWKGGEVAFQRQRLAATFALHDTDGSGFLEKEEITQSLRSSGFLISQDNLDFMMNSIDTNGDGKIDFEEFVTFYTEIEDQQNQEILFSQQLDGPTNATKIRTPSTMTVIGRIKAGVNVRNVNLNKLFQKFNGGGHPKAASATVKLEDESDASGVLQGIVEELIETGLTKQLTVGDFMQSPVLSARPTMTEKQVEDLFIRYDVRALPVVDDNNDVIGLVSYKEVAAAKMRLINKKEKRIRQMEKAALQGKSLPGNNRPLESALKGWMKQHVRTVEASRTMAEVENILLEADVGCIPVVADNTKHLIGMVTRTDLLRQHRYYNSLHYHNKGFSDSIAARKPIIELRKKLKKFDIENE